MEILPAKGAIVSLSAFVVTWFVTKQLTPLLWKWNCVDVPGIRSSHVHVTPRGGGIAIVCGLATGVLLMSLSGVETPGVWIIVGTSMVALISMADDFLGGVSAWTRLAVQCIAAGMIVYDCGGLRQLPLPAPLNFAAGHFAVPLAILWIVSVTNIYNFLDGIDGLAALQGTVVGLAIVFLGLGDPVLGVGLALTGASLGFLLHNWHPAKLFMGDVGSTTIGFTVATVPFLVVSETRPNIVFTMAICLWFFIADAVLTMFLRLLQAEKFWIAHRCHLYQRLNGTGLRHDRVVLAIQGPAAALATIAVLAQRRSDLIMQWLALGLALCVFCVYYAWTLARERHNLRATRKTVHDDALSAADKSSRVALKQPD